MNSSKSILKSTSIIGGSKVISLFFNIVSSKVIALVLGPSGTGFIGALLSSTSLVQGLSGLGVSSSAVRDIAQANAKDKPEELSKTIQSLRRIVLFTGLFGMLLTLVLAKPLSHFTFDTSEYTLEIRILSIAVFFNLISAGQGALIQGMRKIKNLASMSILGAFLSSALAIPLIYFLEMDGIAIYIVMLSIGQYLVSLYYARKIKVKEFSLTWNEVWTNARSMLRLGLSFMGGSMATLGTVYLIRVILIRDFNLAGAGLYQAAMAISGLYINVVLQAMGNDFYPRLTAVANIPEKEIKLMNEQTEIGMLLAAPGLLLTLALAPIAINILYTAEYIEAYPLLQWMILGIFLQTISWPMGYLFIARAKTKMFFYVQVISNILHLGFLFLFTHFFSLLGAGIAFFSLYCFHLLYMYLLVNRENSYQWSTTNKKTISLLILVFATAFITLSFTSQWIGSTIVCIMAIGVTYFSLRKIMAIMESNSFKELLNLIKRRNT